MIRRAANDDDVVDIVHHVFSTSHDFNGMSLGAVVAALNSTAEPTQARIVRLVRSGRVTLSSARHSGNPHIKRIKDLSVEKQISMLDQEPANEICVYPSPNVAAERITNAFDDRPFTKRLALVEPQLTPVFFELPVLERYFRDPRYQCRFGDSEGTISIGDKAYLSEETRERDKISIQSFGIGYDSDRKRVVVVFLRYLSDLSAEHQLY